MSFLKGIKDEIETYVNVEIEGDLGKVVKVQFKATFRRLDVETSRELFARALSGELTDDAMIGQHLIGWRDLEGADGEKVAFSEDSLAEVMSFREYRKALLDAFRGTLLGREAVRAKN